MKRLFLDDVRQPQHCLSYMAHRVGDIAAVYMYAPWVIVRSHEDFVNWITCHGLPDIVSFDHDLAPDHYSDAMYGDEADYDAHIQDTPATGYESAKWLIDYCIDRKLQLPAYLVHSMNPIGVKRIQSILDNFKKFQEAGDEQN